MKKTFLQIIFLFVAMVGYAQSDIHFTILKSETKGLSEDVVDALDLKLHQVFNRNSAAAADVYNVFAVSRQSAVYRRRHGEKCVFGSR